MLLKSEDSGAKQSGLGGIEISLGPAGGAPGSVAAEETELPEAEDAQPEQAVTPDVPVDKTVVEEPESDQPVEEVPEIAELLPDPEDSSPEPEPVQSVEVIPEIVELLLEPDNASPEPTEPILLVSDTQVIEPIAEPKFAKIVPPKRPEPPKQEPVEVTKPAPAPPVEAPLETPKNIQPVEQLAALPPSDAGVGGKSGTKDQQNTGSGDNTQGGGLAEANVDYLVTLQAWLEKHKEYPRRAKRRRQEGTAMLYFVMDRNGKVIEARIEESSGSRLLDTEVMKMIERAQPLPRMPEEMSMAKLELVVPVQFYLR